MKSNTNILLFAVCFFGLTILLNASSVPQGDRQGNSNSSDEKTPDTKRKSFTRSLSDSLKKTFSLSGSTSELGSSSKVKKQDLLSIINLPNNLYREDLIKPLLLDTYMNSLTREHLEPKYKEEVLEARRLMKNGDLKVGREAFIQATKIRTYDNTTDYPDTLVESHFDNDRNCILNAIERVAVKFEEDVTKNES
ncbi:uncharacterized protein LOC126840652 [Adelges cooleyi]|uniref:uncharacterized protein LOC126840652 n=1 Tax=Adelges cooleyi TaxID=133065 RepID=UPI00217FCFE7|nr:uncharacterized protein LOC126840652 [Adelges cooleyi]XP_050432486.1 uncharacterized protein LOC126840652 [Adelges cooleyi]XP_050432487.1 uncharacterized protein LOC126840652 [Adelges cooleyi]XP_050432489.1 uncharacterized protein LOC126840652 [Adelges cooleyi]XP_050432490.1 uncharacterized protein LOC126840652 [Adelges cooleyi]